MNDSFSIVYLFAMKEFDIFCFQSKIFNFIDVLSSKFNFQWLSTIYSVISDLTIY